MALFTLLRMTTNRTQGTWCILPDGPASYHRTLDTPLLPSSLSHLHRFNGSHKTPSVLPLLDDEIYMEVKAECMPYAFRQYLSVVISKVDNGIAFVGRKNLLKPVIELFLQNLNDGSLYGPNGICPCDPELPRSLH
jgi:hypothetical protein